MIKANFYDEDPNFNYLKYWTGREYENRAEEQAIRKLLKHKHFESSADIGGGFGRLCLLLQHYSNTVYLIEPSKKQRELASDYLKGSKVIVKDGSSNKSGLSTSSVDLITMIRVMHHLPNPASTFKEIRRILKPEGVFVLEFANSMNFKSVVRRGVKGKRTPKDPVDIKTGLTTNIDFESPFVNHNPKTIKQALESEGFEIIRKLSVSNLRSPHIKRALSPKTLSILESSSQSMLAPIYFGPSIFYYLRKKNSS